MQSWFLVYCTVQIFFFIIIIIIIIEEKIQERFISISQINFFFFDVLSPTCFFLICGGSQIGIWGKKQEERGERTQDTGILKRLSEQNWLTSKSISALQTVDVASFRRISSETDLVSRTPSYQKLACWCLSPQTSETDFSFSTKMVHMKDLRIQSVYIFKTTILHNIAPFVSFHFFLLEVFCSVVFRDGFVCFLLISCPGLQPFI